MLASPFGEKFHFRTALSLEECKTRIDSLTTDNSLAANLLGAGNYSNFPVSVRRKNRFTIWENSILHPPRVTGKLVSNRGWAEISGRGGANWTSFWSALGVFALLTILGVYNAVYEGGSIGLWPTVAFAAFGAAFMYWRSWEDPNAGQLIDYVQQLLEAEQLPSKLSKTAVR